MTKKLSEAFEEKPGFLKWSVNCIGGSKKVKRLMLSAEPQGRILKFEVSTDAATFD